MEIFFYYIRKNNVKSIKKLIASGIDVNLQNDGGNTALILASIRNNSELVKLLIDAGADVNIQNKHKRLAVDYYIGDKKIFDPIYIKLKKREKNLSKILKFI